jgi:hypothetical protein
MPLCTTHLNGSCGHETSDFEISPGHIDGNASLNRTIVITHSRVRHYRFRERAKSRHLHARSTGSRAQWHGRSAR